jgi:hypothetical protein
MTLRTRVTVLLFSTPVLAFVVVGGLMGGASATKGDEAFQHLRVFEDVIRLVEQLRGGREGRPRHGRRVRGLADGLDPDSVSQSQTAQGDNRALRFRGSRRKLTRFYLRVIAARDGSPPPGGLATGRGSPIDGKPTREMSVFEGTRLLRGRPGTSVALTIIRNNAADPHDVTLVRERRRRRRCRHACCLRTPGTYESAPSAAV